MNAVDYSLHRGERRAFPICARGVEMADAVRMLVNRDGNVTEQSLICEGFTASEIVELFPEAEKEARRLLSAEGRAFDKVPEIIEKAIAAQAWIMPMMAGAADSETKRVAWRDYCTAVSAFKLDPWVSQQERCLGRLKVFLGQLPLIESEINRVVASVAGALKRRARAS